MPEMDTVCQSSNGTPPIVYTGRGPQNLGPQHGPYGYCGYPSPSPHHMQYSEDYSHYQQGSPVDPSTNHQHHMHHTPQMHHPHPQLQQHQQQTWGYGPVSGMMNGRSSQGPLVEEWPQSYMVPGGSSTPNQNHYNYQYRAMNSHTPLDYGSPLPSVPESSHQILEDSPSPDTPSPGEQTVGGMGIANNQGAKSLRAPYEWMKPSTGLPQSGKTRTKDKYRVVYSDHQRLELEKEFHFSKYITIRRKAEIALQLGLSERQVKIWFQNRRAKERKQNKKRQEQDISNGAQDQQMHHSGAPELHTLPFPKIEKEDDYAVKHDMSCRGTPLTPLTPQGSQMALHQNSSLMTLQPPPLMSCGLPHGHPMMTRYHDGGACISPVTSGEELAYHMSGGTDSAGNSINLSGSSDSGVLSSH